MKRKLVFATNNAHKLEEVAAILGDQIELLSLNDIDCHTDIPETADTLEGNALLKSSFIYNNYGRHRSGSGSIGWSSRSLFRTLCRRKRT